MKQCSSCGRQIPDSATVCDACRQWATDVAPAAVESIDPSPGPVAAASPSPRPAAPRRELLVIAAAIVGSGIITLGLLSARGGAAAGGAAAGAAKPAAAPSSPAESSPATSATQTWSSENSAYWVGNRRKSMAFELPAENTVPIWMRSVRPSLVVRCMAQSTQVFVVTESALKIELQTEDHTVTFAFDDAPEVTERWPDSDEHDALFAPDGAGFAQRLLRARRFRFGYTPHNAGAVVAYFNVGGLAPLVEPAAKECGWK